MRKKKSNAIIVKCALVLFARHPHCVTVAMTTPGQCYQYGPMSCYATSVVMVTPVVLRIRVVMEASCNSSQWQRNPAATTAQRLLQSAAAADSDRMTAKAGKTGRKVAREAHRNQRWNLARPQPGWNRSRTGHVHGMANVTGAGGTAHETAGGANETAGGANKPRRAETPATAVTAASATFSSGPGI